ncbi:MAG TPA: PIG-L family deacetylase [Ktedonobacterales bacterium]|jgi:LmbE family N-acetylglucosaminyl deacetylase
METGLRLLAVLAHPDDESLGIGATLAACAAAGIATHLVTATRGERGWSGPPEEDPGLAALGRIREGELRAAVEVLGVRSLELLGYMDGDLDRAPPEEATGKIAMAVRRVRPQVVVTFDPFGAYGHPDHIAISQFTTAAIPLAADAAAPGLAGLAPHRVDKLYYMALPQALADAYQAAFGALRMPVDGAERGPVVWPEWAITTRIATGDHWQTAWRAIQCHRSQLSEYARLEGLPEQHHQALWGTQSYYRALSLVNGGRAIERDLFAGLR